MQKVHKLKMKWLRGIKMLSKEKIKKIVQINNYFFRLINRQSYITFLGLSNDEKQDYKTALVKNNILFDDGIFVLSYQNV